MRESCHFGMQIAQSKASYFTARVGGYVIRSTLIALTLAVIALCSSSSALADNIHLCDVNQFTTCNAGSAIAVTSSQAWAFGTQATGETLYLAVMNPLAG